MTNKTYYLYINSKNRPSNENTYDFNLYLQNQIIVGKNQGLNVSVMSFSMINSMYNINSTNNKFYLKTYLNINVPYDTGYKLNIIIPEGNYSVYSLLKYLQDEAKVILTISDGTPVIEGVDYIGYHLNKFVNISYNPAQNTFSFRRAEPYDDGSGFAFPSMTDTGTQYFVSIVPLNFGTFLGLKEEFKLPATRTEVVGGYINMVEYQQVILKCPSLDFYDLTQDNINDKDNELNLSQILFWVNKQDVEPFKSINYNNEDAGTSYSFNVNNENISSLNFKLCNENDEIIKDADDYLLQLKLSVYDKNESTMIYREMGAKILNLLDDIFYLLLNVFLKKI
jgi:hypothetical protein